MQVMANSNYYCNAKEFEEDTDKIRRGDIIGINGYPGKTKKGELSVIPEKVSESTIEFEAGTYLRYFSDYTFVPLLAHVTSSSFRIERQGDEIPSTLFGLDFE